MPLIKTLTFRVSGVVQSDGVGLHESDVAEENVRPSRGRDSGASDVSPNMKAPVSAKKVADRVYELMKREASITRVRGKRLR